ncbi:mitochondrial acyl carrier protein [Knufia fluminis]|uniref:Acyl carrier protein n=1 Tax=Knufia fluminis TaxID=191047 RepID=A0AAN8I7F0_9EURO|nr:mitochondrial acyl carrier protein [Knufia fluminis]
MFRTAAVRALRVAARPQFAQQFNLARPQVAASLLQNSRAGPSFAIPSIRFYSAPAGLSREEVQGRIMDLLKNFDKVQDASKISGQAHFSNDLGLDSLDTVEVVMAIEEEFSIEIPDKEADALHSVEQAVTYICAQPDAH